MILLKSRPIRAIASLVGMVLFAEGILGQKPDCYTISISHGEQGCQIVRFPGPWITDAQAHVQGLDDEEEWLYEHEKDAVFHRTPEMGPGRIIVSVEAPGDRKSPKWFLVDLDGLPIVRPVAAAQWNAAASVRIEWKLWAALSGQGMILTPVGNPDHPAAIKMASVISRLSPDGKWAVVFRWHGVVQKSGKGLPTGDLMPGTVPVMSQYSVEVINTLTERPVFLAKGHFHGINTAHLDSSFAWLTDRIFWMPLDDDIRDVLVCDATRF